MAHDSLQLTSPAAKSELTVLKKTVVGSIRGGLLMPALPMPLEWVCVAVQPNAWTFDAKFCGVTLMQVVIEQTETQLTLTVQGVPDSKSVTVN